MITVNKTYEYSYGEYKAYATILRLFETVVTNGEPVNKDVSNTEQGNKTYGAFVEAFYSNKKHTLRIPDIDYFEWKEIETSKPTQDIEPPFYTFLLYKKNKPRIFLNLGDNKFSCGDKEYNIKITKFFKLNDNKYENFTPVLNRDKPITDNINKWDNFKESYGCIGDIYDTAILKENAFIPDIYYYTWTF